MRLGCHRDRHSHSTHESRCQTIGGGPRTAYNPLRPERKSDRPFQESLESRNRYGASLRRDTATRMIRFRKDSERCPRADLHSENRRAGPQGLEGGWAGASCGGSHILIYSLRLFRLLRKWNALYPSGKATVGFSIATDRPVRPACTIDRRQRLGCRCASPHSVQIWSLQAERYQESPAAAIYATVRCKPHGTFGGRPMNFLVQYDNSQAVGSAAARRSNFMLS